MATADEILASLNGYEDRMCVIDSDLRTINIPRAITALGVEMDDDVHRLYFQMPRIYSGTDLSTFNIRINYMNANDEGDIYVVTDKEVGTSTITFSWLVGPHALSYKGDVRFIVCLKESEADGTILREFNTTVTTLPVLEGLEVDASPLEGDLVDVLAQLESLTESKIDAVEAAGAEQVQIIQSKSEEEQTNIKGTADYIRSTFGEDYETTVKLQRTRANAIVETVDGDSIVVDDASDDPLRGLRVFGKSTQVSTTGKNLIDLAGVHPASDTTYIWSDEQLTVNGYLVSVPIVNLTVGSTYTLSFESTRTGTTGGGFSIEFKDASDTRLSGIYNTNKYGTVSHTITVPEETVTTVFFFYGSSATTGTTSATYKNIQVEIGSEATDYEPYSGGLPTPTPNNPSDIVSIGPDINITINGANILPYPYVQSTSTVNGCTFTDNGDGSIGLSGTPTDYADITLTNTLTIDTDITISLLGDYENVTLSALLSYNGVSIATHTTNSPSKSIVLLKDHYPKDTIIDLRLKRTGNDEAISGTAYPIVVRGTIALVKYVPYSNTQSMLLSRSLPGIPVSIGGNYTDSNGQQWISDEVDFERGVYVQRINEKVVSETDIINVNTMYADYGTYTTVTLSDAMHNPADVIAISDRLLGISANYRTGSGNDDKYRCYIQNGVLYLRFPAGTGEKTLDECKATFAGSTIQYILATPIETALTDTELAAFKVLHSNFPNTTVLNDVGATMELKYNADTKTWLENLPKASDEQVQTAVDAWLTAHYASAEEASF